MKYRITDTKLPGQELIIDIDLDDEDDEPQVNETQAGQILDWWDNDSLPPGRNYEQFEDGGYIVLVEVQESGVPGIGVWMQVDNDWSWPLEGFPFTSLSYEAVDEPEERPKKFGELRSYPGMNGIPMTGGDWHGTGL